MKLIDIKTGSTQIDFDSDPIVFNNEAFEKDLKGTGVLIPRVFRPQFEGKSAIKADDPFFKRAFKQVYYPMVLDHTKFLLKD